MVDQMSCKLVSQTFTRRSCRHWFFLRRSVSDSRWILYRRSVTIGIGVVHKGSAL